MKTFEFFKATSNEEMYPIVKALLKFSINKNLNKR